MGRKKNTSKASAEVNQDLSQFLKRLREEEKVSLDKLSKGLMTVSQLARIEKGERSVCKNMRDRLLGRMGIANDLYENLLNIEDYAAWELQRDILHAVEQRAYLQAQEALEKYEMQKSKPARDKIKEQFCLVMQAELLKQQGAAPGAIGDCYERAVKLTIPDVKHLCIAQRLLSIQEVNMILEYEFYCKDANFAEKCSDLITFVENSLYDDLSKVKIYPKVVYYYLREVFGGQNMQSAENLENCMEVCNRAIEMLRTAGRAHYLLELLEMKIRLLECIKNDLDDGANAQGQKTFGEELQECAALADLLRKLYAEYEIPAYMQDCVYLYQQRWMFYVGDVLRIRRTMFGFSQKQLCEGVCAVRTLRRAEKKEANMQQASLGVMLGRLGLSREFQRARLVSNDREVLKLREEISDCRNNREQKRAREILGLIKEKISGKIPENQQYFLETEVSFDWVEGKITKEEFMVREEEALRCTLNIGDFSQMHEVYLTQMEMSCICKKIQVLDESEKRKWIKFLLNFFETFEKKNALSDGIAMYEFTTIRAVSELGNMKEYQLAADLAKKSLKEDLRSRRMWGIDGYLYEILWNEMEQCTKSKQIDDKQKMTDVLKQCIILSHFCRKTFYEDFYHKKRHQV